MPTNNAKRGASAKSAAQRCATAFEDLPASDEYLRPIAAWLRYLAGSPNEQRDNDGREAARGTLAKIREAAKWNPHLAVQAGVTNDELLQELSDLMRELRARVDNYVAASAESPSALDEGLLLVTKSERLLSDARMYTAKWALERAWHDG